MLEQIYEIISKSDLYIPSEENVKKDETSVDKNVDDTVDNKQTSEKNKEFLQLLKKNHNFAQVNISNQIISDSRGILLNNLFQLILKHPSDCSKIVALRQFLTHQLGQHLLEFLLKVDIKVNNFIIAFVD